MSEQHNEEEKEHVHEKEQVVGMNHHQPVNIDTMLETHISRTLQQQADRVQFTPELRERILYRLPTKQRKPVTQRLLLPAFALLTGMILIIASMSYVIQNIHPGGTQVATVQYVQNQALTTPAELASGGKPVALDPTGQHLAYAPANQPGVLYTANLSSPATSNLLAMRYARDVAWAPDGSALVATVVPDGTFQPLLALVPTGKYMHLLGHDALAASWSPTSTGQITYVTQADGHTHLWVTDSTGKPNTLLVTMDVPLMAQHLFWSADGSKLAIVVADSGSPRAFDQPSRAIYVLNANQTHPEQIVASGDFTIGNVSWSPDNHQLTYERIDAQNKITLVTVDGKSGKMLFTITPKQSLMGWSWSPDSHTLIYSDGGTLQAHTLQGTAIALPKAQGTQAYPFWLPDGRILYLHITNGIGQLTLLSKSNQ